MFEKQEREKLFIWLYSFKRFNALKKYGFIHYASHKMNYVVMYVDAEKVDEVISDIENLTFVREIERSPQKSLDLTFEHTLDDWISQVKETKINED